MAGNNLQVYRGVTYDMNYTHPSSMTGGTLYFTVKSSTYDSDATDTDAKIKKDITSFTNNGTYAAWTLDDADMYIDPGKYYYGIVFEDSSGQALPPIFTGKFDVLPHTTNRNVGNE